MDDDPSYDICVAIVDRAPATIDPGLLRRAVEQTLRRRSCPSARISVAVVADDRIAELNRRFLACEGPTDVLSFNLAGAMAAAGDRLEGELVISAETAHRQARLRGHSTLDELMLYAIHGTLHLLGMNDQTEADAQDMHRLEDEILVELGHEPVYGGVHS